MKKNLFLISIILLSSCIKEDFQKTWDNISIYPEYAIPVTNLVYNITDKFNRPPSSNPEDLNINYFEGNPYSINSPTFFYYDSYELNLGIDENTTKNVVNCSFHFLIKNAMPTNVRYKLYLQSNNHQNLFSVVDESQGIVPGAQTDAEGNVIKESIKIVDIPLTKAEIEELQNVRFYRMESIIDATKPDSPPVRFFKTSELQITVGLKMKLKLNDNNL